MISRPTRPGCRAPGEPPGPNSLSDGSTSTRCRARSLPVPGYGDFRCGPGNHLREPPCHDFLTDLKERGLPSPLLVISDGASGLIAAIEQAFPKALRQRCLIHRARNVLAKVPAGMQAEVKDAYWAIFDTEDLKTQPGPRLVELIDHRITEMAAKYSPTYPAAMSTYQRS